MNNALIVMAAFAWLLGTSSGLQQLGDALHNSSVSGQPVFIPTSPTALSGTASNTTNPCPGSNDPNNVGPNSCLQTALRYGLDCSLFIWTLSILGSCDINTRSTTFTVITNILTFAFGAFIFLFQMADNRIPYFPAWLAVPVIGPPAASLAYIAFTAIRGNATA